MMSRLGLVQVCSTNAPPDPFDKPKSASPTYCGAGPVPGELVPRVPLASQFGAPRGALAGAVYVCNQLVPSAFCLPWVYLNAAFLPLQSSAKRPACEIQPSSPGNDSDELD